MQFRQGEFLRLCLEMEIRCLGCNATGFDLAGGELGKGWISCCRNNAMRCVIVGCKILICILHLSVQKAAGEKKMAYLGNEVLYLCKLVLDGV